MEKNKLSWSILLLTTSLIFSCATKLDTNELDSNDLTSISSSKNVVSRDVTSIIKQANAVYEKRSPELVQLKYQSMAESVIGFYRATNYIFYKDLAKTEFFTGESVSVQGDLHVENIGSYKTGGTFSYDLNDFDDSTKGSYTWDITRCAVSIVNTAQENGFSKSDTSDFAERYLSKYIEDMKLLKNNPTEINNPIQNKYLSDKVKKLLNNVSTTEFKEFASDFTDGTKLIESKKIKRLDSQTYQTVFSSLKTYFSKALPAYELKDVAFYVAGKGSLGKYRYMAMLRPSSKNTTPILIDVKESSPTNSVAVGSARTPNEAQRVINYSKFFLSKPDSFFGSLNFNGLDFFARSIFADDKVDIAKLNKNAEMNDFIDTVAYVTARAHSRSGKNDKILSESVRIMKIKDFALSYAEQVKEDYKQFKNNINLR